MNTKACFARDSSHWTRNRDAFKKVLVEMRGKVWKCFLRRAAECAYWQFMRFLSTTTLRGSYISPASRLTPACQSLFLSY
jgi:hypothetical protein